MKAGTAWADITPSQRIGICGQMHVRYGEYVHDPLTVNAVAFEDGVTRAVLVSCDLCFLPDKFVQEVQSECEQAYGLPVRSVIIACTHTHLAPYTSLHLTIGDAEPFFMDMLRRSLLDAVGRALDDIEEVELFAGKGFIDQMGFNRRGYHKDGTVDMYHGSWTGDFAGLEGPRDGEVGVIFARRADGSLKVVIPSFSTHPNSMESESFYSADLVGAVRNHLRLNLGADVGVVYLTGAAGNTAPTDLESDSFVGPWRGEEGWRRSGLYLGSEILKVIAGTTQPMADPVLRVNQAAIEIPIAEYKEFDIPAWARECCEAWKADWPRLMREESPVEVRLNVLRLGDAAICTNPAEFYCEYGLAIKGQSPARVTIISELTDGSVDYVPTPEASEHGGYSARAGYGSKLADEAGDMIVETTVGLLRDAFS